MAASVRPGGRRTIVTGSHASRSGSGDRDRHVGLRGHNPYLGRKGLFFRSGRFPKAKSSPGTRPRDIAGEITHQRHGSARPAICQNGAITTQGDILSALGHGLPPRATPHPQERDPGHSFCWGGDRGRRNSVNSPQCSNLPPQHPPLQPAQISPGAVWTQHECPSPVRPWGWPVDQRRYTPARDLDYQRTGKNRAPETCQSTSTPILWFCSLIIRGARPRPGPCHSSRPSSRGSSSHKRTLQAYPVSPSPFSLGRSHRGPGSATQCQISEMDCAPLGSGTSLFDAPAGKVGRRQCSPPPPRPCPGPSRPRRHCARIRGSRRPPRKQARGVKFMHGQIWVVPGVERRGD